MPVPINPFLNQGTLFKEEKQYPGEMVEAYLAFEIENKSVFSLSKTITMRTTFFQRTIIVALAVVLTMNGIKAQDYVKPDDSTTLFNRLTGTVKRGTLIKTANNHFYEINEKFNQKVNLNQAEVKVYKDGKKYKISIQGIDKVLGCNKIQEVIDSYIDGDFKGWDGNTIFKLLNRQEWQQDAPTSTIFVTLYRPAVFIYLSSEGYKMKVAGVDEDPILVRKIK